MKAFALSIFWDDGQSSPLAVVVAASREVALEVMGAKWLQISNNVTAPTKGLTPEVLNICKSAEEMHYAILLDEVPVVLP